MRDLTEEELKLAPDWATHWYFYNDLMEHIVFENEFVFQTYYLKTGAWSFVAKRKSNISRLAKPLPTKPFDITKHEVANHVTVLESGELVAEGSGWIIDKERAIAIAKALGVRGEDLK